MENFQIYGVQIAGKCICNLKRLSQDILTHAPPPGKLLPQVLIITPIQPFFEN